MEMRRTWLLGKECGFELGLRYVSPKRYLEELNNCVKTPWQKEFYDKFLELCGEYNVRITYHPNDGMKFEELQPRQKLVKFVMDEDNSIKTELVTKEYGE